MPNETTWDIYERDERGYLLCDAKGEPILSVIGRRWKAGQPAQQTWPPHAARPERDLNES